MRSTIAKAIRFLPTILAGIASLPVTAAAQAATSRLSLGGYGGFAQSAPLAGPSTSAIGYSAGLLAQLRTPLPLLQLRADLMTSSWGEARQHFEGATLGAVGVLPVSRLVRPYLLAAGGAFTASGAGAGRGWLVGAGAEFPVSGHRLIIESRMYSFMVGQDVATRIDPAFGGSADPWRYSYAPLLIGFRF